MNGKIVMWSGYGLVVAAIVMGHFATKGFGDHFLPMTVQEAICDLSVMLMALTGYVMTAVGLAIEKGRKS